MKKLPTLFLTPKFQLVGKFGQLLTSNKHTYCCKTIVIVYNPLLIHTALVKKNRLFK